MRPATGHPLAVSVFALVAASVVALPSATAQPASPAIDAAGPPEVGSRFYLLSFKNEPIADVADSIVGQTLGESISIDPAIQQTVSFQAEGWFTPDALLRDLGATLMDSEAALVRSAQGDLAVVPRSELGQELSRGAVLISAAAPVTAPLSGGPTRMTATAQPQPIVYGRDRWRTGPFGAVLLFLAGAITGAGALRGGQIWRSRRRRPISSRPLMIGYHPLPPETLPDDDGELIIPRFRPREP